MAGKARITDKLVRAAETPAKGQDRTYDTETRGFVLRVTPKGVKSFAIEYRTGERNRRYTIGRYPDWSVQAARNEAKRIRQAVDRGDDPAGERAENRAAITVKRLTELYARDHMPNKKDASGDRSVIEQLIVPRLGKRKVADLRRADIREWHRRMTVEGRPIRANRALACLSKMLSMAVTDYEERTDNPCKGIPRNPENQRERFLSQAEIGRLLDVLNARRQTPTTNFIRFLMLTGARRGEARHATWEQFDLTNGIWLKPATNTKQAKVHRVPLAAATQELLQAIYDNQAAGEAYVFPGRGGGAPLNDPSNAWESIRNEAGIPDVRLHDLRHSFASILASRGMSLPMIGKLLGHNATQTTARYAHLFDAPLREAAETVGSVVTGASGGDGADVVPMKRGQGHG